MISGANEEELELASARMDIMLATNYTPDNPGPLSIIDKYHDKEIKRLNNIIDELEKELDNLIIFNQSNITCNHHTPDDWKDSKLIGNMLYKIKPVSFLAQELKDKLKALKEGKENDR